MSSSFVLLMTGCKVRKVPVDSLFHGEPILYGQLRSRLTLANRLDFDLDKEKDVGDDSHKQTQSNAFLSKTGDINFNETVAASEKRLRPETAIVNANHQFLKSVQPPAAFQNAEHEITEQEEKVLNQITNTQNDKFPESQNIEHESTPYSYEKALGQDFFPWNDEEDEYGKIENDENIDIKYEIIIDWENSDYKSRERSPLPDDLTCEKCGIFFPTKQRLDKHLLVHSGRKDFLCPHCLKKFNQKSNLTTHIKKMHKKRSKVRPPTQNMGRRNQKYSNCNRTFERIPQLMAHSVVNVSSESPKPSSSKPPPGVSCPQCPKKFASRVSMGRHFNSFHLKKRAECPHCDKSYTQSHSLKEHIKRIHLGEQYDCRHCGKKLSYLTSLKAHIKSCHKP